MAPPTLPPALTYVAGQCTRFVAEHASWIPGFLGDAKDWLDNAKGRGFQTSPIPIAGSVMVLGAGQGGALSSGHVALVDSVNQDWTVNVSEQNWTTPGQPDKRQGVHWQDASLGFIIPPGSDATAAQHAYASGQPPPATPADQGFLGIPGAIQGFGSTVGNIAVAGLLVGIGGLLVLGGLVILALAAVRGSGAAGALSALPGAAGAVGKVAGYRQMSKAQYGYRQARAEEARETGQPIRRQVVSPQEARPSVKGERFTAAQARRRKAS